MAQAATGSGAIASGIAEVAAAAQATTSGVTDSQRTADELAQVSADLHRIAAQFRV